MKNDIKQSFKDYRNLLQETKSTNLYQLKVEMGLSLAFTPIYEHVVIFADNLNDAINKFENDTSYNFDEKHLCDNQGYGGVIEEINILKENISPFQIGRDQTLRELRFDIEMRLLSSNATSF